MTAPRAGSAVLNLREAQSLLLSGMQRIMHASDALPQARTPLHEALQIGELHAMRTLEALEGAHRELGAIRAAQGGGIDDALGRLDTHLRDILTSQQAQDLAGQQLQKTIALLGAVESRIDDALRQLGMQAPPAAAAAPRDAPLRQSDVDDLLTGLGL